MKKIGRLCVITDTTVQKRYSHYELAKLAVKGGADMIQLRDKFLPTSELILIAAKISGFCKKHKVLFLVNDRVDVAMIAGADGVHLGKEDIPVQEARKLLGRNKIIGGTAHSLSEARLREKEGADYIGYGHIFPTASKHKPEKPKGTAELGKIVMKIKTPIIAIGGISIENISEVMQTGVFGAAFIGSVVKNKNPQKAVKELREAIYGK
ncbi:MAG: thiamine phosphate synthase [Ignavibacteria bacterium]|nr:thiamine phosphate synthase [Ignavibacteria bacterium]